MIKHPFFTRLRRAARTLTTPRWQPIIYAEVGVVVWLAFAVLPGGFDYWGYFHRLATGCINCTYNPYFTEWFLRPLGLFDWRTGYVIWCAVCIAALYPSAKQLGGNPLVALFSPTFLWILWLGQVDMLAAIGLALAWWSVLTGRRGLAGFGLLLMATKPQLMGFAILALALWGGWRTWVIPLLAAIISFAMYGMDWVSRWLAYTPQTVFGGDAWFYITAPWLLIAVIGVFWVRSRKAQLQYLITATTAGAPYLGAYSFFVLTLFSLRWWEVLAGYVPFAVIGVTGNNWWLGLLIFQPLLVCLRLLKTHQGLDSARHNPSRS